MVLQAVDSLRKRADNDPENPQIMMNRPCQSCLIPRI